MSFSNDVRMEIVRSIVDRDRQYACLYGILLYSHTFTDQQIVLQSENPVLASLLPTLFQSVLHIPLQKDKRVSQDEYSQSMHSFSVTNFQQITQICSLYHIHPDQREIYLANLVNNSMSAFLAGVFLICGSIMNPKKEYHLEFNTPSALLCSDLQKLMHKSIGVNGRQLIRKNMHVLYFKDSEQIEDTLTYMGAQQCTIELMNIKIHKDMRNKANRLRNCDEANINKVVSAAMRQTEDIRLIIRCGKYNELSPELRELAELRLKNPELSLKELGEMLSVPIGRSGVNHRFQKIATIAEELRSHASSFK